MSKNLLSATVVIGALNTLLSGGFILSIDMQLNFYILSYQGALAIRRIFSLVDMITKPKFSYCPNVFKIGLFR